jgi:DNA invertase Pin-like site-specific DNA recombinase
MKPAVAYYRMSTDRQEKSIPAQREAVRAYAKKHGYRIVREYVDEGISGDETEKRVQFQRMRDDAGRLGDFRAVLCWDQDRFGRFDTLDAGYWVKPFRDAGVWLETVAQGRIDWDDFAGRIVYAVQQEAKHSFLVDLSRVSIRGSLAAARLGQWNGGPPPYAYRVENKRLVPGDPEEIEIVRWLFRTYAETTASLGELAARLNERGVPSPGGTLWHKTTVQKILDSRAYLGEIIWGRRHEGKYHCIRRGEIEAQRGRGRVLYHTREDWVIVPDAHEPLVERGIWEKAKRKRAENRHRKTPHKVKEFLFTRLVYCSHCGWPMHGITNVQKDRDKRGRVRSGKTYTYRRYICGRYNAHGKAGCRCNTIPERQLRAVVQRKLFDEFLDPRNLAKLREEIGRQLKARRSGDPDRAARSRAALAELDRQIDAGTERYLTAPKALLPDLAAKIDGWKEQREGLRAELVALREEAGPEDFTEQVEKAIGQLPRLREEFDCGDPARLREVIRQMVARIDCTFEYLPHGKDRHGRPRFKSVLSRGLIHLRPDLIINRDVPSGRPLMTV